MTELEATISINLGGNLAQQSRRFTNQINQFADSGNRRLSIMRRTTANLGRQVDRLSNRYTALLSGAAGGAAVKFVADLDAQLRRTATDANLTDEQIEKLRKSIFEVANSPDIRIDANQLLSAFDTILSKTGDMEFAQNNIRNIGLTMQGLGADALTAGGLLAQFWEKGIRAPNEVMAANDRIFTQFGKGALAASQIARVAPKLFSVIQKQGPEAVAEMGALAQLFVKTTGSADEAVTSIRAVFRTFNDPKKLKLLEDSDIKVFTDSEKKVLRPANELLRDIIETANANTGALSRVFDATALEGLVSLLDPRNRDLLDELTNGTIELGRTQRSSQKNAEGMNAALENLQNVLKRFADDRLAGPIQSFADALNSIDSETLNNLLTFLLMAGGGLVVGRGVFRLANIGKKTKGGISSGNSLLDAASKITPVPVFVVNGPGGIPGFGGKGKPTLSKGRNPFSFSSLKNQNLRNLGAFGTAGALRAAGLVGLSGAAGFAVGTALNKLFIEGTEFQDTLGRSIAKAMAALGNENAQESLAAEERLAKIEIELTGSAAPQARVKHMEGNGDVEVSGQVMGAL